MADDDVKPRRSAFWRGAAVGIAIAIPLAAIGTRLLVALGLGDPGGSFSRTLALAFVFGALPAALSAGGVARIARRAAERHPDDARFWAIRTGMIAFAPAGVGLLLLSGIPVGGVPDEPLRWLWILLPGSILGAAVGALIGRISAP